MLEHIVMDYCAVHEDGLWSRKNEEGVREREINYQLVFSCVTLSNISGSLRNSFNCKSQNVFSNYSKFIGVSQDEESLLKSSTCEAFLIYMLQSLRCDRNSLRASYL